MKKFFVAGMAALFALAMVSTAVWGERQMGPPNCDRMGAPCGPMGPGGDREAAGARWKP